MSNTPGISPITTDIEEVRHSDEDGFLGDDVVPDEDVEEADTQAREVVEEGRCRPVYP